MRRAAALIALGAALLVPTGAAANGDPASDVLIMQDVYLPYAPPTAKHIRTALEEVLEDAREAGYPMKVALIASPSDLGAYPTLFNRPQDYANLLNRELPANRHGPKLVGQHILVVMPAGFGGNNLGERVDEALGGIEIQAEAQSDGLAVAAIEAVARLATINGFEVPTPPEADLQLAATNRSTERGGPSILLYLGPAVLLFVVVGVVGRIAARRSAEADAEA